MPLTLPIRLTQSQRQTMTQAAEQGYHFTRTTDTEWDNLCQRGLARVALSHPRYYHLTDEGRRIAGRVKRK